MQRPLPSQAAVFLVYFNLDLGSNQYLCFLPFFHKSKVNATVWDKIVIVGLEL